MASDSSASTSPMVLTPDSTGSTPDASAVKKARRQTAFYPNMKVSGKPQKPFSRSAAKRESVMALGSIEHLQHYFTKTGIAAKRNPLNKPYQGLVPAIGGPTHIRTSPSISSQFELPPSPVIPEPRDSAPSYVKSFETDPESLLPGVIEDLTAVSRAWHLEPEPTSSSGGALAGDAPIDILDLLKVTTRTVQSIRSYLIYLPDESINITRSNFRPHILGPAKPQPSSSASSSSKESDSSALIRRSALEVLSLLRTLEERCRLPLSDEAYDAQSEGGTSRGEGGAHSRVASPNQKADELPPEEEDLILQSPHVDPDTSVGYSFVRVQGRHESVPVWEDEEITFASDDEEKDKRQPWEERLVVGNGWLYRQDVTMRELEPERAVVQNYLETVDEVLFDGKKGAGRSERGWEVQRKKLFEKSGRAHTRLKGRRVSSGDGAAKALPMADLGGERRRVSTGMLDMMSGMRLSEEPEGMDDIREDEEAEESVDDDDLPDWAKRSSFADDELGRAHAVLSTFLPSHLLPSLHPPTPRIDFLASLSSGQLLCMAYNSCVRKSKKPWGYVNKDGIHDIIALEKAEETTSSESRNDGTKKGWTFRRIDNLRLWAGALKLRYSIPLQVPTEPIAGIGAPMRPSTPVSSPMKTTHRISSQNSDPPLLFDAKVVARKDEGWETMLEKVLLRWIAKVVEERRSIR